MPKQYAARDIVALDKAGGYYLRHVTAIMVGLAVNGLVMRGVL